MASKVAPVVNAFSQAAKSAFRDATTGRLTADARKALLQRRGRFAVPQTLAYLQAHAATLPASVTSLEILYKNESSPAMNATRKFAYERFPPLHYANPSVQFHRYVFEGEDNRGFVVAELNNGKRCSLPIEEPVPEDTQTTLDNLIELIESTANE